MDGQSYSSILAALHVFHCFGDVLTNIRQVGNNAGGDSQADFILVNVCGMEDFEQVLNCSKFNGLVLCWL
jgi:hypothetical protein